MNILYNVTCVHIVPVDLASSPKVQHDGADTHIISAGFTGQGGLWAAISHIWLAARTKYVCYLPPGFDNAPGRFHSQTEFMEKYDLAGSYTDMTIIDPSGSESMVSYPQFSPEMIGTTAMPTESLLVDRQKFMDAGGFDFMLSGAFDPIRYLNTMTACAGQIMHLPKPLVKTTNNMLQMAISRDISYKDQDFAAMNKRLRLDRWVSQARQHYKSMRWEHE